MVCDKSVCNKQDRHLSGQCLHTDVVNLTRRSKLAINVLF